MKGPMIKPGTHGIFLIYSSGIYDDHHTEILTFNDSYDGKKKLKEKIEDILGEKCGEEPVIEAIIVGTSRGYEIKQIVEKIELQV